MDTTLTSTIQPVDISSQERRNAILSATRDDVSICAPEDNLHNERDSIGAAGQDEEGK